MDHSYLPRQHRKLRLAAEICNKITFDWLLPEELETLDLFEIDFVRRRTRGELRVEVEKSYLGLLHGIFATAFDGISQRLKVALLQFERDITLIDGIRPGHEFPTRAKCEATIQRLSVKIRTLRRFISSVTEPSLGASWTSVFEGGADAIQQCELMANRIAAANVEAAAARQAAETRKLAQQANDISIQANVHSAEANSTAKEALKASHDANVIADGSKIAAEKSNTIADDANRLSQRAIGVAEKADKTGRATKLWTAATMIVALFALGWDVVKYVRDDAKKHETATASSSAAVPGQPSSPSQLPTQQQAK